MNILGQDFEGWVTKQVNLRQASLNRGSGENAKDTLYQQSKTPWIRLASSIDVDNDGGTLAKSLILQGSISKRKDLVKRPKDMSLSNDKLKTKLNIKINTISNQIKCLTE